jgi:hypothetical protein
MTEIGENEKTPRVGNIEYPIQSEPCRSSNSALLSMLVGKKNNGTIPSKIIQQAGFPDDHPLQY